MRLGENANERRRTLHANLARKEKTFEARPYSGSTFSSAEIGAK
jgi:hypothetical protein